MTKEDKDLLIKDICARLPYGVKVMKQYKSQVRTLKSIDVENCRVYFVENDVNSPFGFSIENPIKFYQQVKPYLRPMSSMTDVEHMKLKAAYDNGSNGLFDEYSHIDWLNSHHFDFRGLIAMGLALEAPDGMYKNE